MNARALVPIVTCLLVAVPVAAQVNFKATPVLQSGATASGAPFAYPKTDSAEVTALLLEIGPGGETGRHMHPNPAFVYVLEGAIEVDMDGGMAHTYKAGDSFLEVLNTWHNGKNKGTTPAKVLVVFSGVKGKPNLIRPS
jgi:quercetin dioxygenase-like cupin family protein